LTCPNCGHTIEPGFRFCPDCGFRLIADGAAVPTPATAPQSPDQPPNVFTKHIPAELAQKIRASTGAVAGERKLVTVMFCDVAGSTAIAECLDPEEYHELLEQYLALAFREIYRLEGIVNQLAGDGMMALFGAPLAHENAPERAIEAALAIRGALSTLNQRLAAERGLTLRARIGIHTGPVVVGTVGNDFKMDYTAIGDTTNLASRLESLAEPGTVLISEATERLVRGLFVMRAVGPFEVKGKREAITAFEVLQRSPMTTPMAIAAERALTPLIGREEELAQLAACFERLGGDLAQVIAVVGPAGSGKSRLLYEFKRSLDGQRVVFLEGRCASLNQVVPYAVWINMLRQYFNFTPSDLDECACEKMLAKMPESDETMRELFPYLCRLLALPAEPLPDVPLEELKSKTFEAVARLVMAASNRAPVIMLLEDLQWIDEPSREMLDLAVAHLRGRVMLVVTHRPDYQPAWHTQAAFTQLNLRPLSDQHTAEIIRALAGGRLPAELEGRILVKAEGNPFVAEEITRALLEQGVLLRGDDQVRLTRPVADVRIPDTVQELIGARLDQLGPQGKRVVQVAAVLGRQFQRSQLEALLEGEGIDVGAQLELLESRGIIHRKNLLSRDEFRFGESLTQEVAYEALLLKERRHLHARIGRLLEAAAGELTAERSALIAHHYALGDDRERALAALLDAARHAEQLPSYPMALRFYRQAWQLADAAVPETQVPNGAGPTGAGAAAAPAPMEIAPTELGPLVPVALETALGLCRVVILYGSSEAAEIERPVRRARAWAEALGNAEALAGAYTYEGLMMMSGARTAFADGVPLVEKGFAVAQRAGLTVTATSISRALAVAYVYDGRCDVGQETLRWAVTQLERLGEKERLSDLYLGARQLRDSLRCMCDDLEGAAHGATETYEQAVRVSNRTVQSLAASTLALVHFTRAQYPEARRWADTSLAIAEVIGNVATIRTAAALALTARASAGEAVTPSRYLDLIEQGHAARSDMAVKCYLVAEAFLTIGEVERARRFAEIAYAHAGGQLRQAWCATALGDIMLRLGPSHWSAAERWYQQALGLAEALGARSALATAALGAGELALAQGNEDSGQRSLRQTLAIAGEIGFARLQARAQKLLEACNGRKRRAGSPFI
jgi:class 3 adenylate cyclase/ABC-type lipoprotein export system ATPase subunit